MKKKSSLYWERINMEKELEILFDHHVLKTGQEPSIIYTNPYNYEAYVRWHGTINREATFRGVKLEVSKTSQ